MIYEGSARVTLITRDGDITQHREVMIDGPDKPGAISPSGYRGLRVTVIGPPMKGVDTASTIQVTANGTRYQLDLKQRPEIEPEQTVFGET